MSSTQPLCHLVGINSQKLSKNENILLEAELFSRLCEELKNIFREQYQRYFDLLKFDREREDTMLEASFLRFLLNDILLTEEYSLEGIAYYTQIPEDVICDVMAGTNSAPSLPLSRKIIDLHRSVRPNLYREIIKKILDQHLI